VEIAAIELQKSSEGYKELKAITSDLVSLTQKKMADVQMQNLEDMQYLNAENLSETARLQREQLALAQGLQTKQQFIGAFALEKQAEVLKAGAESLGTAGVVGGGGGGGAGGGGFNPAGVMMGIGLGGVLTGQMSGMMAGLGSHGTPPAGGGAPGIPGAVPPGPMGGPPPMPPGSGPSAPVRFMIAAAGAQYGPYDLEQLRSYSQSGQLVPTQLVWRDGMPAWLPASQLPELAPLFAPPAAAMPPMPPPPMPTP
jgi:hypothetical protein